MGKIIDVSHVTIQYPRMKKPSLVNISLSISKEERIGLVGASGSGKSTLLHAMAGILAPTEGTITYTDKWKEKLYRYLTVVVQHPRDVFSPRQSIEDFLSEPLRNFHLASKREISILVRRVLDEVEIPGKCLSVYPHEVSGGQLQRVVIARALLLEPDCIFFDEPTSALDVLTQYAVLELITALQKEHRFASVFVSHDLGVVQQMSNRIVVLSDGHMVEVLSSEQSKEAIHPASKQLVAAEQYEECEIFWDVPILVGKENKVIERKKLEEEPYKTYRAVYRQINTKHEVEVYMPSYE